MGGRIIPLGIRIKLLLIISGLMLASATYSTADLQLEVEENRVTAFETMIAKVDGTSLPNSDKQDLIDAFILEQKPYGFPVINNEDVYFVYQNATATGVVYDGWSHFTVVPPMKHVEGTDLWYLLQNYELDARVFYGMGAPDVAQFYDPLNNRTSQDLILGYLRSELRMPDYYDDGSTLFNKDVGSQIIDTIFTSSVMDGWTRSMKIYLPPGYDDSGDTRYPTMYVMDSRYLIQAHAENILNYMIVNEFIDPIIVVFLNVVGEYEVGFTPDWIEWWGRELSGRDCLYEMDPVNNPAKRNLCAPKYAESISTEVVPFIDTNYPTMNDSTKRAHTGFSFAADMSSYIVSQYPEVFKLAGIQEGWFEDEFINMLDTIDPVGFRFYVAAGALRGYDMNLKTTVVENMENNGFNALYRVFNQGHDWGTIQRSFSEMLKFLFTADPPDYSGSPVLGEPTVFVPIPQSTYIPTSVPTIFSSELENTTPTLSNEEDSSFRFLLGLIGIFTLVYSSRRIQKNSLGI